MKLNQIVIEVIDGGSAILLKNAVNAFLETVGEATLIDIQYQLDAGAVVWSAMIIYSK